jgi:hypothetical protein
VPKALDLLAFLVEQRPRAVSRQELYDRVWPNTFVDPANLHNLIYQIREVLHDADRSMIKTAYGFGFAFAAAAVEETAPPSARWQLIIGDREIDLREGENIVGREAGVAARIESSAVSRRHACILVAPDQIVLEDLGSKNGTNVNGRRVHRAILNDGDAVLFGTIAARVVKVAAAPSTQTVR